MKAFVGVYEAHRKIPFELARKAKQALIGRRRDALRIRSYGVFMGNEMIPI